MKCKVSIRVPRIGLIMQCISIKNLRVVWSENAVEIM